MILTASEARGIAQKAVSLDVSEELASVLESIRVAAEDQKISLTVKGMKENTKRMMRILEYGVIDLQDGESCVYW